MLPHLANQDDGLLLIGVQLANPGIKSSKREIHSTRYVTTIKILAVTDIQYHCTFTVHQLHQVGRADSRPTLFTLADEEGHQQKNEDTHQNEVIANKFENLLNQGGKSSVEIKSRSIHISRLFARSYSTPMPQTVKFPVVSHVSNS